MVLDCLLAQGFEVLAIFDAQRKGDLFGIPYRGPYDDRYEPEARAIIAIGDNATRKRIAALTKHAFVNAVHPSVLFSPYATLGVGNMILHGAIVQPRAVIEDHVIVNTGATIDHDCHIGSFVHIAPGTSLCGNVTVGEGALIGAGSVVIPGRKIGAWSVVGAGSVVIHDIPDFAVVVGNPARVIKYNSH